MTKSIGDLVIDDLKAHIQERATQHGGPLVAHQGPDKLGELYEQLMDALMYIRCLIEEVSD